MRSLLPALRDARVLDLGCGFGELCRFARKEGARSVLGIDVSQNMLGAAAAATNDTAVVFRRAAIEDVELEPDAFEVAISSLVLHHVERLDLVCEKIYRSLRPGGAFAMSVEHPICTAIGTHRWCLANEKELHWPLDNYTAEGMRRAQWLGTDVIKYHRTVATYVNTLLDGGFRLSRLLEPVPPPASLAKFPGLHMDLTRPAFLLIGAVKPQT